MSGVISFIKANFPSPSELYAFLSAYQCEGVQQEQVNKWYSRESVPGSWLFTILALLEIDRGSPVSLAPYMPK